MKGEVTKGRWQLVSSLYHEALTREGGERAAFLCEACQGDETLQQEIESLLRQTSAAEHFLASGNAGRDFASTLIDRQIGAYRLTSLLGTGGMGEVYRARDTKLGREVALKVLPAVFTMDADRRARFRREARVLATLNHPHIGAIYGLEDADGVQALVLELVEGVTLADRIARGPIPLKEALPIARQIAEALDAAHRKGVIHRDLKPANIKITPDGAVKVLDFGLAKILTDGGPGPAGSQAPTASADGTREGMLFGTAAYMSPEQARGKPLDTRGDVWAFGCVLFEMLAGESAFAGETLSDTLARILDDEPDWSKIPVSTPAPVRELLRQCLEKDAQRRLRDVGEARVAIDISLSAPFTTLSATAQAVRWGLSRPVVRWTAAAATITIASLLLYRASDIQSALPQLTNPIQVTRALGVEDHPTWSPDGRTLAYESNESGNWDIWLAQVDGGQPVNRTADHSGHDLYPSWAPDGRQIAFWSNRDGGGYFLMPALGGPPARVIAAPAGDLFRYSAPEWSADGTRLAAVVYAEEALSPYVDIVSLATREVEHIELRGTEEARLDLSWSRDGRFFAYVEAAEQQSEVTQLRVLRRADGQSVPITDGRTNVRRPRWSADGRDVLYVANRDGPPDLWRQHIAADGSAAGEPERVTAALEVRDAVFSPDGTRLAYSKGRWVANVWRVPILENRAATWADATQITFDQAFVEFIDVSPDGQRLAYSSDRSGNQDLWAMPFGGEAIQLTFDHAPDWSPGWSPDGRELAFYSYRTGDREIWKMPATGGVATQLTFSKGLDAASEWSPDGREIAFRSERTGTSEIWTVSADGSRSRQLTDHPAGAAIASWSPDGRWLAFGSKRGGLSQIWRVRADGGEPELLTRGSGFASHWAADGNHIYFSDVDERAGNIWEFSLKSRRERPVTNLVGKRGTTGRMAPKTFGSSLYFTWREDLGDIWVMDVARR